MSGAPSRLVGGVSVRVPAKVNLFLAVRGRRRDGLHDIVSIMHTVGLHDRIDVDFEGPAGACYHPTARRHMAVELEHDRGAALPQGEDNLVIAAARALASALGAEGAAAHGSAEGPVTRVRLTKRIPIGGGMAGGSADAAATLVALNRLWGCELRAEQLRDVAGALGADVPFCVSGGTALATGTGTATAQVLCRGRFHWVLGIDDREPLATQQVYEAWDRWCGPSQIEPDAVLHALRTQDAEALGAALHNDLQAVAFRLRPHLAAGHRALLEAGALGAVVSGSGPTVVGLAGDGEHAALLAQEVAGHFDRVEVVGSPAGGPEILAH